MQPGSIPLFCYFLNFFWRDPSSCMQYRLALLLPLPSLQPAARWNAAVIFSKIHWTAESPLSHIHTSCQRSCFTLVHDLAYSSDNGLCSVRKACMWAASQTTNYKAVLQSCCSGPGPGKVFLVETENPSESRFHPQGSRFTFETNWTVRTQWTKHL